MLFWSDCVPHNCLSRPFKTAFNSPYFSHCSVVLLLSHVTLFGHPDHHFHPGVLGYGSQYVHNLKKLEKWHINNSGCDYTYNK